MSIESLAISMFGVGISMKLLSKQASKNTLVLKVSKLMQKKMTEKQIKHMHPGGFQGYMTPMEAVKILGLKDYCDPEIHKAYKN